MIPCRCQRCLGPAYRSRYSVSSSALCYECAEELNGDKCERDDDDTENCSAVEDEHASRNA